MIGNLTLIIHLCTLSTRTLLSFWEVISDCSEINCKLVSVILDLAIGCKLFSEHIITNLKLHALPCSQIANKTDHEVKCRCSIFSAVLSDILAVLYPRYS